MATEAQILDCSDIDQYLGKVIESSPIREPLGNNDIRRCRVNTTLMSLWWVVA